MLTALPRLLLGPGPGLGLSEGQGAGWSWQSAQYALAQKGGHRALARRWPTPPQSGSARMDPAVLMRHVGTQHSTWRVAWWAPQAFPGRQPNARSSTLVDMLVQWPGSGLGVRKPPLYVCPESQETKGPAQRALVVLEFPTAGSASPSSGSPSFICNGLKK